VGIEPTRTNQKLVAHHLPSLFNSNDLLFAFSSFLSLVKDVTAFRIRHFITA